METVTDILLRIMGIVERFRTGSVLTNLQMAAFAVLLVFGALNCILGYRLLRFWMMLFAFLIGAGLGFGGSFLMGTGDNAVRIAVSVGVGVVLAVIVFFSYKAGIFVLGAGLGIGLGVYVLHPTTSLMFFICLLIGVMLGSLAMKWAREVIIVGTSLLGGAMAGMSLAKLSGLEELPYGVGLSVGFALLGMLIQFATNKPRYLEEDEDEPEETPWRRREKADSRKRRIADEDEAASDDRRKTGKRARRQTSDTEDEDIRRSPRRRTVHRKSVAAEEAAQARAARPADHLDSEKTIVYRPRKKPDPELDLPLDSYAFQDPYGAAARRKKGQTASPYASRSSASRQSDLHRDDAYREEIPGRKKFEDLYYDDDDLDIDELYDDNDDSYGEPPIDEEKLDEEILREMMEDDDRESIFPWKKSSDRKRRKR